MPRTRTAADATTQRRSLATIASVIVGPPGVRLLGILAVAMALALVICADSASAQEVWSGAYGGEVREQYELFANEEWGKQPADGDGYLLQRYMLHGELKHGTRWRLFGELKSGIEVGR